MKAFLSRSASCVLPALLCAALFPVFASGARAAQAPIVVDADLAIPLRDLSSTAIFYPVQVNGVVAEFFAVRAPDGTVRIAVDACQACGPAGFTQIGEYFRCTACGQDFHVSVIERRKGGCNPIPVGDRNKRVEADRIVLPLAFLRQVAASRYAKGRRG